MRRAISTVLVLLLMSGGITVFASEAGGPNDPLVSLSYAQTWADKLLDDADADISSTLNPVCDSAIEYALSTVDFNATTVKRTVYSGGTVTLKTGATLTLLSGAAAVSIKSGSIVNATVGASAVSGKINLNQYYIACENTTAVVTSSAESVFLLDGSYTIAAGTVSFSDVRSSDWFYSYVYFAADAGLIDGFGDGTFRPSSSLTVAQAIKLAACMHKHSRGESVSFADSQPWYKTYVDYAVEQGIIESSYASLSETRYNSEISRKEYVHIFYGALNKSCYSQISTVPDGSIPDVAVGDTWADEIYAFYRAGILTGSSGAGIAEHAFLPNDSIKRSEVTAVITRMLDSGQRISTDLS